MAESLEIKVEKTDAEKIAEANAETAVAKAEKSGDQADIDAANAAIANVQAKAEKDAFTARINAINAKLAVTNVTADNAITVKVTFNKPMDVSTATTLTNYTIGTANPTNVTLSNDKTTATLTLPLASKLVNKTVYPIKVSKNIVAASSDAMDDDYTTNYTFNDTTAPTLGAVSYPDANTSDNTAKVSFSEPMDALSASNVKIFDENGVDVTGTKVTANAMAAGDTDLTLSIASADLNKPYTVYVYGAKDLAGNYAGTKSFTVTKANADTTAPTVTSVKATALDTFVVTFSEPIETDPASGATDGFGDYTVGGVSGHLVSTDTNLATTGALTLSPDKTQLTVVLKDPVGKDAQNANGKAGLYDVKINSFYDLSANKQTTAYDKLVDFETNNTVPKVASTSIQKINNVDNLVVKFDDSNIVAGAATSDVISGTYVEDSVENTVTAFGTPALIDTNNDGKNDAVAIPLMNDANPAVAIPAGNYTVTLAAGVVKDATTTNSSAATPITFNYAGTVAPTVKPTVSSVAATPKYVTVAFNKDVTAATALNTNNYAVDGQNIFSSAIFEGNTKTVKLTLKANTINADSARLFTVSNIADADGNVMDPHSDGSVLFKDNTAPKVISAKLTDASTIVLTFNKAVGQATSGPAIDNNDFDVYVGGNKVDQDTTGTYIAAGSTGTTITLKLKNALTEGDLSNAITITPSANNDVVDANGNAFNASSITVSHN